MLIWHNASFVRHKNKKISFLTSVMRDPIYAKSPRFLVKEEHSGIHIHRNSLSATSQHLHLRTWRQQFTEWKIRCLACFISFSSRLQSHRSFYGTLHPDLPEMSEQAAVWHCSWHLRWKVSVQAPLCSAELPGCDWSPHLVTLSKPSQARNIKHLALIFFSQKQDLFCPFCSITNRATKLWELWKLVVQLTVV